MTTVYPTDTTRCALCDGRIKATKHIGFYLVGARAAIAYALCKKCAPKTRAGLPPGDLRKLDAKLEAVAERNGLTGTH